MADPVPDPVPNEGLSTAELETLIGGIIDTRLAPLNAKLETLSAPDLETFRTSLLGDVTKIVTDNKTAAVDEDGLLSKVGGMLDEKMKGISTSPAVKRVGGPLSRWLAGKA